MPCFAAMRSIPTTISSVTVLVDAPPSIRVSTGTPRIFVRVRKLYPTELQGSMFHQFESNCDNACNPEGTTRACLYGTPGAKTDCPCLHHGDYRRRTLRGARRRGGYTPPSPADLLNWGVGSGVRSSEAGRNAGRKDDGRLRDRRRPGGAGTAKAAGADAGGADCMT